MQALDRESFFGLHLGTGKDSLPLTAAILCVPPEWFQVPPVDERERDELAAWMEQWIRQSNEEGAYTRIGYLSYLLVASSAPLEIAREFDQDISMKEKQGKLFSALRLGVCSVTQPILASELFQEIEWRAMEKARADGVDGPRWFSI
jgi:hypothetical protein